MPIAVKSAEGSSEGVGVGVGVAVGGGGTSLLAFTQRAKPHFFAEQADTVLLKSSSMMARLSLNTISHRY